MTDWLVRVALSIGLKWLVYLFQDWLADSIEKETARVRAEMDANNDRPVDFDATLERMRGRAPDAPGASPGSA